jgi:hypothetical protein
MSARKWIPAFTVSLLALAPLSERAAERREEREGANERIEELDTQCIFGFTMGPMSES